MTKIKVISEFRDKFHYRTVYKAGDIAEFDAERAKDLIERGLAQYEQEEIKLEPAKVKKK